MSTQLRKALLGMALLGMAGCMGRSSFWAYFNSFYNCKSNFAKAEKLHDKGKDSEATQYYQKAVEKGSRILKYYPRSAYMDDALFIIGVSHMRMGDMTRSEKKFEELLLYYPTSPFAPRARLYLGKTYLENGHYVDAIEQLTIAVQRDPSLESEALVYKAEALVGAGQPAEAVTVIEDFMARYPKSPYTKDAYFIGARAAKEARKYEEGAAFLEKLLSGYLTQADRAKAQVLLGDIYYDAGDFEEASRVYASVDLEPGSPESWPVEVKKGMAAMGKDDNDAALGLFKNVMDNGSYEYRAEAYYRSGLIYEGSDSLDRAKQMYEEAGKMGQANYPLLARRRLDALREWQALADSSGVSSRYRYAEVSYLYLKRYDEAVAVFTQIIADYPKTDYAPKSLYALMHYDLKVLADTPAAATRYAALQSGYGQTLYAQEARRFFGDIFNPPQDSSGR